MSSKRSLQSFGAVTGLASPRFRAVEIAAQAPVVRILHTLELEVLLPVRALFLKRRRTETNLDPFDRAVRAHSRLHHVAQILVSGDGSAA